MIPDHGRYHGCVFALLIDDSRSSVCLAKLPSNGQGFYLVDGKIPMCIKFSRNRKGPWTFNFMREHRANLERLRNEYGRCVIALVCGADGIVALDNMQLSEVLQEEPGEQNAVIVRRKLRHMYSVSGASGKLPRKIARDSLVLALTSPKAQMAAEEV